MAQLFVRHVRREKMSYKSIDGTRQWDESKRMPEERMVVKMQSFAKTGVTPDIAGADLSYALKLQYERWKEKGLKSTMEIVPVGNKPQISYPGFFWNDEKYTHIRKYDYGKKIQKYYKDGKCIHTKESQVGINAIVTNTTVDSSIVENDIYNCPSCGAGIRIKELMEGCPYCQSKFMMTDLFPKVTNFYLYEDDDSSKVNLMLIPAIIGGLVAYIYEFLFLMPEHDLLNILLGAIAIPFGAIAGYILGVIPFMGYAIYKAIAGIGAVGASKIAEKKIEKKMKSIDNAFSYKLFESQLISFLKMTLFTSDYKNLACFEGTSIPEKYRDLVDMSYNGVIKLKSIETVGDVVKLNVQVPMRNTYYNKKIKIKDEKINLQIARKITTHTNSGFSIKRVACKSCGGSFDGTHQRICPFCNSAYDMKEEGWVITEIMG